MTEKAKKYLFDIYQSVNAIDEYLDEVDAKILWGIIIKNLPELKVEVESLLNK